MITFFDSETTGLVLHRERADHPKQPHLVQLGAILCDENRRVVAEINLLVKPDGWTIPAEATAVHGITTEMCERYGLPLLIVANIFIDLVQSSKRVVAHNFPFDRTVIHAALLRLGLADAAKVFLDTPSTCTMAASTPILRLPGRYGDFKWPSLQEAHTHFLGKPFDGSHDAMADVRACMAVYYAMNPLPQSLGEIS